jgi:hypothetical protein
MHILPPQVVKLGIESLTVKYGKIKSIQLALFQTVRGRGGEGKEDKINSSCLLSLATISRRVYGKQNSIDYVTATPSLYQNIDDETWQADSTRGMILD